MNRLHSLLKRQLKRHFGTLGAVPKEWDGFIAAVDAAYVEFDTDRVMLERSLELSSGELFQANFDMRALFEALPDLFFRIDKNNIVVDYKAGNEMSLALPPEQVIGMSIHDVPLTNIGKKFFDAIRMARNTRSKTSFEYSLWMNEKQCHYEARLLPLLQNQLIVIIRDITERKQAENILHERQERLQRRNQVLLEIAKNKELTQGDLDTALKYITESAAQALAVERVSIWFYNEERTKIVCADLFERSTGQHSRGLEILVGDYPNYFAALKKNRVIAAHDTRTDPRMSECVGNYLESLDISSLLDAPVRASGRTVAIISHEHTGPGRQWTVEEQHFAGSMADVIALALEVRERQRAQTALSESENKFRILAETTDSAIFVFQDKIVHANPAMERMTGYSEQELLEKNLDDIVHIDSKSQIQELVNMRRAGITDPMRYEVKIITKDGSERWLYLTSGLIQFAGRPLGLASAFDITERKEAEEQLRHQAFHDKLTGLPNRALFMNRLEHVFARNSRHQNHRFAVMFIDLDRFKVLNDSLGHTIGDEFLKEIAKRMETSLRPADSIARIGGDEFCILLEDVQDAHQVARIAERLLNILSKPFSIQGNEVFATASIGIALSNKGYQHPDHILRDADIAMYRAKANGRACYKVFDSAMDKRASDLLELETDLRHAIKREEFEIHYQPIVELDTQVIAGFEALIRWQHPRRGLVPPLEFIPLAEETGMIVDIGKWVLREACRQLQVWHKQFPMHPLITLSVNVSGKQLARAGFIDYVKQVIEETGVDARCLKIELTESVVMANPELAATILAELRNLNVQVYVDDFGTGYSSLSYLHKFPIDALKVDRSFVSNIGLKEQNLEIVRTIVLLAHNLNLTVIAEGVETEEQLQHLRKIGCNQAQGYYFSQPVVSQQATTLLKTRQLDFDPRVSTGFSRSEKNRRRRKAV